MQKKISFFLDSGAFSAWSKGVSINIRDYIKFIKDNINYIDVYSVLDDIQNPEITLENQKIMEESGLKPLPCYHFGENIKYLEYYIKNYDYIAFGGMVPISTKDLIQWLDNIFKNYICDEKGYPKIKIHGFGLTSHELLIRFPWYSVDSTSWVMCSRFGGFYMPLYKNGKFDYLAGQLKISVSNKNTDLNKFDQHYFNMIKEKKEIVNEYLKIMGFEIGESKFEDGKEIIIKKGLSNDYQERDKLNIKYYLELEKAIPEYPRKFEYMKRNNLF